MAELITEEISTLRTRVENAIEAEDAELLLALLREVPVIPASSPLYYDLYCLCYDTMRVMEVNIDFPCKNSKFYQTLQNLMVENGVLYEGHRRFFLER